MLLSLPTQLLALAACVLASPHALTKRAVIGHDKVVGFRETVPSGVKGELYLKYKPSLKVFGGCVPFPVVDSAGNTGGGLNPSGRPSDGCNASPGQVYARSAMHNGAFAIMYSWYMPKDSPGPGLGHRHDWENVVVWLSGESATATIRGVAISAHGNYQKETRPQLSGTRPKVGYISYFPANHQLISTDEQGGDQPLIAWESMTPAAQAAIENTDFKSAIPSFRDSNFDRYLNEAFI
ncbi:hypothetical protein IAQ61_010837 [Plenodomus lingam]|uniref:Similar to necrosis-and ethylene-inducing protein 1 n=1 Tax=Leptosphaeria maculans (strain JN3 / isolate v23.1.3 / race Av1-4-5-6-7-8) TaxID=985895 RepID=E4ZJ62_LEPMJ|nr:similar to necrosis-and ethylene-inducing protein 1 precursor [Plenodomus lingam JN3]KAH9861101.1 hypothetical protein IAQ61_010837 [Plenodomus lingam]CBX91493.1 similar to necrosis-and ethylene-inducing protein 1 precursor [Plenodomus lingam JN3]